MAAVGNSYPTLLDMAKKTDPDGRIAMIAEVLSERHPSLDDIPFIEGNLTDGHRFTSRLALPSVGWRQFNEGVAKSKSRNEQIKEVSGMLGAVSKIDVELANTGGRGAAYRRDEEKTFLASMANEFASALFYSSLAVNPDQIHGLLPRLNSTTGDFGSQVQLAANGASPAGSDQTSMVLIGWAPDKVAGFFPRGSTAGLSMKDKGEQVVQDGDGNDFLAYTSVFSWHVGLMVMDYRYVVRVCNIDTSLWTPDYSAGVDLAMEMIEAEDRMESLDGVTPVWYMHRNTLTKLKQQLVKRQANWLEMVEDARGINRPHFNGIRIRTEDALLKTETIVS